MNVHRGENGIRYVFAVSSSNKKHKSKKVSVENMQSDAVGRVHRKKTARLQEEEETREETSGEDVELTIISASESGLVVGNHLDNENITDGEPISKKRRPEVSSERNGTKSNLIVTNDQLLVRSSSVSNYEHPPTTDDDTEYVPLNNYRTKSLSEETTERRSGKFKVFRDEWLEIDIFRDWLDRDPTNPRKARCVACNTTMNAGKSELEKHAAGARHERAVEAMHQTLQQLVVAEAEVEHNGEVDEEEDSSNETKPLHAVSLDADQPEELEHVINSEDTITLQEQQLLAMNRMATAIESLSGNMSVFVERMSGQQDELISVLRALQSKVCSEENTN